MDSASRLVPAPLPPPIQGPRVPPLVSRAAPLGFGASPLISRAAPLVFGAPSLPGVMTSAIIATKNKEMKKGKDEICLNLHLTNYLCNAGGPWNLIISFLPLYLRPFSSSSASSASFLL